MSEEKGGGPRNLNTIKATGFCLSSPFHQRPRSFTCICWAQLTLFTKWIPLQSFTRLDMATISELSENSLTALNELVSSKRLSRHEKEVSLENWQDEIWRLKVWVRNTGAHKAGQSSMEYRLRDSQLLLYQTVKLLLRIHELLTDLREILDEEDMGENLYEDKHGGSLEESEDNIDNGTEIQYIHKSLGEVISYLHRISTTILRIPYDNELVGTDKLQAHTTSNALPLASSLTVLTMTALQASQSLYNMISTQESDRSSWELGQGLAAFNSALEGLQELYFEHEAALISLKLPLCHCAKVCREFEAIIGSNQKHIRGWAKTDQKRIDLQNLNIMLSEYRATISIALGLMAL